MDFKEILKKDIEKNEIALGYDNDGILLVDYFDYPSIVITGETGSGKSILLDQIILQLIKKYTSLEMGIISIDTCGVELNYYKSSNYSLYSAMNDEEKSVIAFSRVLREIERRKTLFKENKVLTFEEYNNYATTKLPLIVVAVDDDKSLLNNQDMEKMVSGIINNIKNLGIIFIMATNDIYNKFFINDNNLLSSILITFDLANKMDTLINNIDDSDELMIGHFIMKKDDTLKEYHNFEFDDKLIDEIVNQ